MRTFNIDGCRVALMRSSYPYNDSLAVVLDIVKKGKPTGEQYGVMTVCLGWPAPNEGCAFIDSNAGIDYEDFVSKYGLAWPTGNQSRSGFCTYKEYQFNDDIVDLEVGKYL